MLKWQHNKRSIPLLVSMTQIRLMQGFLFYQRWKMKKEKIIEEILEKEWKYFSNLNNIGGRADCQDNREDFIKQCKNTRDSSTRRVLVMRHILVGYELHEDFSKHIGKLVCRRRVKLCNEETELLGTLKASMTTT